MLKKASEIELSPEEIASIQYEKEAELVLREKMKDTVIRELKYVFTKPLFYINSYLKRLGITHTAYQKAITEESDEDLSTGQMLKILLASGYYIDLVLSKGTSNYARSNA